MTENTRKRDILIGCAGWAISKEYATRFPGAGTHLARYARELPCVEINSSFYKPHKPSTYTRWAESVPDDFRFAVKLPKEATHTRRLVDVDHVFDRFLPEVTALGEKLGPLLIQLPPSLAFCASIAEKFFVSLRQRFDGELVLEPRHSSWFGAQADQLAAEARVARAAADPAVVQGAEEPGGWDRLVYYRLHGSPKMYYSAYPPDFLAALSQRLTSAAARSTAVWCIFDNTAAGAATANAFEILARCSKTWNHQSAVKSSGL